MRGCFRRFQALIFDNPICGVNNYQSHAARKDAAKGRLDHKNDESEVCRAILMRARLFTGTLPDMTLVHQWNCGGKYLRNRLNRLCLHAFAFKYCETEV